MKKIFIATLLSAFLFTTANACDICGGGSADYNPFLFPHLSKNYIGLNFLNRSLHGHNHDGSTTRARYSTLLIFGQYSISRKVKFLAFVPYSANMIERDNNIIKSKGTGDVILLVNYKLWDKAGESISQSLIIGGGAKLHTGTYTQPKTEDVNDRNFQLGTGSIDYILNGSYRMGYGNWVVNAIGSYKYNTANKEHYRFGDILTAGGTVAYQKTFDKISIAPYVQVVHESQMKDADKHVLQDNSGGSILYTGAGMDVSASQITIGANYQFAANSISKGELNANPRFSARISFAL